MIEFIVNYWLATFFGILISLIVYFYKKLKATIRGVRALIKSKLLDNYRIYLDKGNISLYEKENIEDLYKEYKLLGGNGIIDDLIEEIYKLPIKDYK
jgi:hypothetical protein